MSGHIRMQRGWRNHQIFRNAPYSHRDAWGWLIESACWKPIRFDVGGAIITLERGQLCYSIRQLGNQWRWSKTTVTRFLARLRAEKMIQTCSKTGTPSGTGKTIITICNYSRYQAEPGKDGTPSGTKVGQERDTKEEREESKKRKYRFTGKIIRLTEDDFNTWQKTYHGIPDLNAALVGLDGWWDSLHPEGDAERKKWFNPISAALNNRHQVAIAKANKPVFVDLEL